MKNQTIMFCPSFLTVFLAASGTLMAAPTAKQGSSLKYYNRSETRVENREESDGKVQPASAALPKRTTTSAAAYSVKSGDTISKIARKFDTTPANLMKFNGLTDRSVLKVGQSLKVSAAAPAAPVKTTKETAVPVAQNASGYKRHEVRKGETISKLSRAYDVPVDAILAANNLKDGAGLRTGREILIPTRGTVVNKSSKNVTPPVATTEAQRQSYEIHGKDTFYSLAAQNGITVEELQQANPGVNPERLHPGMSIKIPVRNSRARPAPPAEVGPESTALAARDLHSSKPVPATPILPLKKLDPLITKEDQTVVQRNLADTYLDYTVEPGDTWETIGGQFRTSSDEVKRLNGIRANDEPMSGVTIRVPRTRFMHKAAPAGRVGYFPCCFGIVIG